MWPGANKITNIINLYFKYFNNNYKHTKQSLSYRDKRKIKIKKWREMQAQVLYSQKSKVTKTTIYDLHLYYKL